MEFDVNGNGRSEATSGVPWPLRSVTSVGGRVVSVALRPLEGALESAVDAAGTFERRAVDRVLGSAELERVLIVAVDSPRIQTALQTVFASAGAQRLVDDFFDSGMFDRLVDRLLASDALWRLVDELAQSPAVTAAISQQGLGFADQVGDQVRQRSRRGDDWLERAARRVIHRRQETPADLAPEVAAGEIVSEVAPAQTVADVTSAETMADVAPAVPAAETVADVTPAAGTGGTPGNAAPGDAPAAD